LLSDDYIKLPATFSMQYCFRTSLFLASLLFSGEAAAETNIYKCTDADGGVVYSQLPCAPQKRVEAETPEPDGETETKEPEPAISVSPVSDETQENPESGASRETCKKRYRDAIDAIDAEIARDYTAEKGDLYKQRLMVLTRNLRQC